MNYEVNSKNLYISLINGIFIHNITTDIFRDFKLYVISKFCLHLLAKHWWFWKKWLKKAELASRAEDTNESDQSKNLFSVTEQYNSKRMLSSVWSCSSYCRQQLSCSGLQNKYGSQTGGDSLVCQIWHRVSSPHLPQPVPPAYSPTPQTTQVIPFHNS